MSRKTCVLFLINSLGSGGAERQLVQLMREMDQSRFDLHVAVLYDPGYVNRGDLWPEAEAIRGVTLHSLHKRRGALGYLTALPRLLRLIWAIEPAILHGYLQGNLAVLIMGLLLRMPIVWGVRRTSGDLSAMDRGSRWLLQLELRLSRLVDLAIFNSEAGLRNYRAMGMSASRMLVVPNGFDLTGFRPDPSRGADQRRAWGIPSGVPLVGIAGRLHPVKDHPTFLRMAARLNQSWPTLRFVCIGEGEPSYLEALRAQARDLGLDDRVHWPGPCQDMAAAYNALDLLMLTSTDEGLPNVLGEAMACGVPCVTTPAGDAALVVGDAAPICPIGDDEALASAASALLREPPEVRASRSLACRNRIETRFSSGALARATGQALLDLLAPESPVQPAGAPTARGSALLGPRYLIRIDDLCPTIDWAAWQAVEDLFVARGVKPILAVIPDNRDPRLMTGPPNPDFWHRVRAWQARGWTIGLHGYQHIYVNSEPGLLNLSRKSEFAGLSHEEQLRKLRLGLEIFQREGVRADVWVAPSHSFDENTLSALAEVGLRAISDGLAFSPFRDSRGLIWVPQQFARMRALPWGIWTSCVHPVELSGCGLEALKRDLTRFGPRIISLPEALVLGNRRRTVLDDLVGLTRTTVNLTRGLRTRSAS